MKPLRFGLLLPLLPLAVVAQSTTTACTGLCLQQVQCPSGGTTTLSGTVYAPNGTDPIPNVTVYIPNAPVEAFQEGISCPVPGAAPSGSPLTGSYTAYDGTFKLANVPVGTNIPLVIVAGKWRRQFTVPATTACTDTTFSARFAKNQSEGDIPKFAVLTGGSDEVECVLRKVGLDDAEFVNLGGQGRVQLVQAANTPGALIDTSTKLESSLMGSSAVLNTFDVLMLPCEGNAYSKPSGELANLVAYANGGGRVYASHYAYEWMYKNPPFDTVAQWRGSSLSLADGPATVNQGFGSGATLAKWLQYVGASSTPGQIDVSVTRSDITGVNSPTRIWLTLNSGNNPMQFTWDAPVGAVGQQCGRVLFDEYHVENPLSTNPPKNKAFPTECSTGAMTAQEKLLEYSLFDLSNNGGPASLTPDSADFGKQAVGYTTAAKTFTITNNSVFTSTIVSASATGDFTVTGNTCASVPSGSSCTVSVVFTPTALDARTGSLAVTFAGTSLTAALTGVGVPPFTATQTALTYPNTDVGASVTQSFQIASNAPAALTTPTFAATGDYAVQTNCPASLAVGASCQVNVIFTPTAVGSRTGSVTAGGTTIATTGVGVDFSMKSSSNGETVVAGVPDVVTVTATPLGGFNAPVTLSCTTNMPATTCTIDKTGFTLGSEMSTKVTLQTTAQYSLAGYGNATLWTALLGGIGTAGVFAARRKSRATGRVLLACTGLLLVGTAVTGCSGKIPTQNGAFTPAGNYTVTVTGTDGFLKHSATYAVTVKGK